jgi:hypothetical protein
MTYFQTEGDSVAWVRCPSCGPAERHQRRGPQAPSRETAEKPEGRILSGGESTFSILGYHIIYYPDIIYDIFFLT